MMHTVRVLSGIVYHARDLGTSTERLSSAGILQGWGSNWPGWPDEVPEVEIGGVVEELGTYAPISVRKIGIMFGGRYVGLGGPAPIRCKKRMCFLVNSARRRRKFFEGPGASTYAR